MSASNTSQDSSNVGLRTNLYRMNRVSTWVYQYAIEINPSHHQWHAEIARKFLAINRSKLKWCYPSNNYLFLCSPEPLQALNLNSMVDHEKTRFVVKLKFSPLHDLPKWQHKEVLNIILYFWKKHYRIFGDMFYDPKRKMGVLKRDLWVVAGFQFAFHDLPKGQMLDIVSRVYCCDKEFFWINPYTLTSDAYEEFSEQGYHFSKKFFLNIEEPVKLVQPFLNKFGIDPVQVTLKGQVLVPPPLLPSDPNDPYYKPPKDSIVWALLAFDTDFTDQEIEQFRLSLTELATQRGLDLHQCVVCRCFPLKSLKQMESFFIKLKEMNTQLLLVGSPQNANCKSEFLSIKHFSKIHDMIIQFFITADKELYFDPETGGTMFEMLLIRVNQKLSGKVNTIEPYYFERFAFEFDKMMMIGATVNDPKQEGFSSKQFVAILVASMNFEFDIFVTVARLNEASLSVITRLKQMFGELLQRYHTHNGYYPRSVLYFRHDYHAENCFRREVALLEQVITSFKIPCRVVYVAATKITKVRFTPNIETAPSTALLIDSHLESDSPSNSFYIYQQVATYRLFDAGSHAMILDLLMDLLILNFIKQHHLRPTRYSIIQNQVLSTDQLRQICFALCHFYLHKMQPLCHPIVLELTLVHATKIRRALDNQLMLSQTPVLSDDVVNKILEDFC